MKIMSSKKIEYKTPKIFRGFEMNAEDPSESCDVRKTFFFRQVHLRLGAEMDGLILIPWSPATQDFKPRKTTRETRGHVITHPLRKRRSPVRHSVGKGYGVLVGDR